MTPSCHACGGTLDLQPGFESFQAISSDIQLAGPGIFLAECQACHLVQKPNTPAWREATAGIYARYELNHQGQGADPFLFSSAYGPGPRATLLTTHLQRCLDLPAHGTLLDIGCGNGNVLAAFSKCFPGWELHGLENSLRWKERVCRIPGVVDLHTELSAVEGRAFDLIVMSHVLEHIPGPVDFLHRLTSHLRPTGHLILAVPDFRQNPIDLLVLDHCSHFDSNTLADLLHRSGFLPSGLRGDLLGKELLAWARPDPNPPAPTLAPFQLSAGEVLARCRGLFQGLVDLAQTLQKAHRPFGVFGSSTAAAWIAGELALAVDFFVDEDPHRVGGQAFGRPILAPNQIPESSGIFIPLSARSSEAILRRIQRPDLHLAFLAENRVEPLLEPQHHP